MRHTSNYYELLAKDQIELIHHSALKVLEEVGVKVESNELLALLGEFGGTVDSSERKIYYPASWVEQFIADSELYDWQQHTPQLHCAVGIFAGKYLNFETDGLENFTEKSFRDYVRIAKSFDAVDNIWLLGVPFTITDIPPVYGVLAEKLYSWKYGVTASGTIQFTRLCPYIVELYERFAAEKGCALDQVFNATGYLVSPLRLAEPECSQILYFRSKGLHMNIGHLLSLGGSTPVTVAGGAVMNLAEALFLNIFRRALTGSKALSLYGLTMVMDMGTASSLYGRPEQSIINSIMGQLARHYGARYAAHCGQSDAKQPSVQAGMQKALSAMSALYSCGDGFIDAGLLSIDEVFSPEQLVYDVELANAMRRMLRPIEVTEETCALEEIKQVGAGGFFTSTEFTAQRFRQEIWEPKVWDRQLLNGWLRAGAVSERQRAKELLRNILSKSAPLSRISEECEADLRRIIQSAIVHDSAKSC